MHIPENYLSPESCAVMGAVMIPVAVNAVRKVKKEVPKEKMPLLGVAAAFSFIGMMFNVPLPGGTTGHAVGGTLIAIMLGPHAACIAVMIALLIQALLFGDGGILAYGANCFNMAFILPYVGYGVYKLILGKPKGPAGTLNDSDVTLENGASVSAGRRLLASAIGSYAGINAAAFCAAIEFGLQPALFHTAGGEALYCPYGLSVSIPAMMIGHLTIFGLAEVVFTVGILAFVMKTSPGIILGMGNAASRGMPGGTGESGTGILENPGVSGPAAADKLKTSSKPLLILLAVLICAVPLGLIATGTAWGEWGVDEISGVVSNGVALGYTPKGMEGGFELSAIMPDYSIAGLPEVVGYILSAIIGIAICIIIFRIISAGMKKKTDFGA